MKASIRRAYLEKRNKNILQTKINSSLDDVNEQKNFRVKNNNSDNYGKAMNKSKVEKDSSSHEENEKQIEKLLQELNDIEKENKLINTEINSLKKMEREQEKESNKIMREINKNNLDLNKLKEINATKNDKYLQLRNLHRDMLIRDIRSIHRETVNELNRHSLHRFFERLVRIYRGRDQSQEENNPPLTNEQIQTLPVSTYPRNNNRDEKCVLCGFPFCYNDTVIKLRRCNHIFHRACLINTLTVSRSSLCPTCRLPVI